jgi:hypothetical protein
MKEFVCRELGNGPEAALEPSAPRTAETPKEPTFSFVSLKVKTGIKAGLQLDKKPINPWPGAAEGGPFAVRSTT